MKTLLLTLFIILVSIANMHAQQSKGSSKPVMQYQYVLSHQDSLQIKQLMRCDWPINAVPKINPYDMNSRPINDVILENNVIIFDGDMNKK